MDDSCGDLLLLSFSPISVVLLILKYSIVFFGLFLCSYGLYQTSFGTDHKVDQFKSNPTLNKLLVLSLAIYLVSFSLSFLTTIFSSPFNYADTEVSMFDTSAVDTTTIVRRINEACDISLSSIESVVDPILAAFGALQFTCLICIYDLRLVLEFKDQISSRHQKVLLGLLGTFCSFALVVVVTIGIDRISDVGLNLSYVAYIMYLFAMGYTWYLYKNKLEQDSAFSADLADKNASAGAAAGGSDLGTDGTSPPGLDRAASTASTTGILADSSTVDRIAMYRVTLVLALGSSVLGVIFSIIVAAAGGDENSVLELLQGIFLALDSVCNCLAIMWQFGIARKWYGKMCASCHARAEMTTTQNVVQKGGPDSPSG